MVRLLVLALAAVVLVPSTTSAQVAAATGYGYVPPETAVPCGDGGVCAAGSACVAGLCRAYDGTVSSPVVADAEYEHRSRIHRRLMIAGGVMLGATWLANGIIGLFAGYRTTFLGSSSSSTFDPEWDAFRGVAWIPVLGPWIQLGLHHQTSGWNIWLSIDGIVQAAGLALLIAGGVLESENHPDHPAYTVLPMIGDGTAGLLIAGAF